MQFEKIHHWQNENIIISNNVNLIFNIYRLQYFQTAMRAFDVVRQLRSCHGIRERQESVEMERFWNLQLSKFVNHNGAKIVDVSYAYGMSTNLLMHGPKWNSADYGLETRND